MTDIRGNGPGNGSGNPEGLPPNGAPQGAEGATPGMAINIQYVKDLSFEVPGAPDIFVQVRQAPQVAVNLDVNARRVADGAFEVVLSIRAEAKVEDKTCFIVELDYAGVFTLTAIPQDMLEPVLLVEAPRLLFPFARSIMSDVTRESGFPAVLLQPIDFLALWQSRRAQTDAGMAPPAANA
ncbi:protein-export chaperone SecB [Elioraea sp.]|uniref:protein-export chaperone SecB n=1 Tax=Elioraea sp. TaxID=2185103 RepID=UPI0025C28CB7|nr:protein-export chaperone SecB [Elioraea sp.]